MYIYLHTVYENHKVNDDSIQQLYFDLCLIINFRCLPLLHTTRTSSCPHTCKIATGLYKDHIPEHISNTNLAAPQIEH